MSGDGVKLLLTRSYSLKKVWRRVTQRGKQLDLNDSIMGRASTPKGSNIMFGLDAR